MTAGAVGASGKSVVAKSLGNFLSCVTGGTTKTNSPHANPGEAAKKSSGLSSAACAAANCAAGLPQGIANFIGGASVTYQNVCSGEENTKNRFQRVYAAIDNACNAIVDAVGKEVAGVSLSRNAVFYTTSFLKWAGTPPNKGDTSANQRGEQGGDAAQSPGLLQSSGNAVKNYFRAFGSALTTVPLNPAGQKLYLAHVIKAPIVLLGGLVATIVELSGRAAFSLGIRVPLCAAKWTIKTLRFVTQALVIGFLMDRAWPIAKKIGEGLGKLGSGIGGWLGDLVQTCAKGERRIAQQAASQGQGGVSDSSDGADPSAAAGDAPAPNNQYVSYTQDEINRIVAEEVKRALAEQASSSGQTLPAPSTSADSSISVPQPATSEIQPV